MDDLQFYVLFARIQPYQEDGRVIMIGYIQWHPVYGCKDFRLQRIFGNQGYYVHFFVPWIAKMLSAGIKPGTAKPALMPVFYNNNKRLLRKRVADKGVARKLPPEWF